MPLDPETVLGFLHRWGYLLVFVTGVGEGIPLIGIFTPGHIVILVAGAAASAGALDLTTLILVALAAGVLGDVPGFYVGRRYGRNALDRIVLRFPRVGKAARASDELFEKRGAFALVLCRFSFLTRSLGPLLSGMSRMPARTFWLWNVAGAVLWAFANCLMGYFFGLSFLYLEGLVGRILAYTLLGAVGLALVYRLLRRLAPGFTRDDFFVAILGIAGGVGFGLVADKVARVGAANALDARHADFVAALAPLHALFDALKLVTSFETLGALSLGLIVALALRKRGWEVVLVAVGVGGALVLVGLVRGAALFGGPLRGFPSAHAAVCIVAFGVLAFIFAERSGKRATLIATSLLALVAALAEFAYLSDERPTLVLGGLLLGVAWLSVAILLVEFGLKREPSPRVPSAFK